MTINSITPLEAQLEKIISNAVAKSGYRVIRVKFTENKRRTLQIMIERIDDKTVTVHDCETVSKMVSVLLDVEDPIPGHYHLEVSSPGIDRPLMTLEDFERFGGFEAKLTLSAPVSGAKRYTGKLLGIDGSNVKLLLTTGNQIDIEFSVIATAKLILNDALIEATRKNVTN